MGLETAALIAAGLSVAKGVMAMSQAKSAADATVKSGNIELANRARKIKLGADSATNSFLTSGLMLEGTPQISIGGIFDTGIADLNQQRDNINTKSKSQIWSGRMALLSSVGQAASFAAMGAGAGGGDPTLAGNIADGSGGLGYNTGALDSGRLAGA